MEVTLKQVGGAFILPETPDLLEELYSCSEYIFASFSPEYEIEYDE